MQDPNTNKLVISSYLFIRILAAATINFSLAGVWLLIEGGSYLREAIINFGAIDLGDIDTIDSFFMTDFRIFVIDDRKLSSRTKPRTFSAMFLPQTNDHSWLAIVVMPT